MLESVLIQNFKGFKNTSIGPFRMVNLIIGGQNVGKTSVLEAVFACVALAPYEAMTAFRQKEGDDKRRYFNGFSSPDLMIEASFGGSGGIVLTRSDAKKVRQRVSGELHSAGLIDIGAARHDKGFRAWFVGGEKLPGEQRISCKVVPFSLPSQLDLVRLFGQVVLLRRRKLLIELLRKIEPRLESMDAIAPDGEQRIYAELEGVHMALPLNMLGHGFSRVVYLFSELLVSESQLALVDEIENGIHYSALPVIFQGIKAVAQERQVQSLITTHSWDCLRAACEVFEDTPEMFQVIRLEQHEDDVKAVCIDGARMLRLMAEEREVR